MSCAEITEALALLASCEETSTGARLTTQCLYPSFKPVRVYVAKVGDGYRVHDGGGAFDSSWLHGRDHLLITRAIHDECARFKLKEEQNTIFATVSSKEWLLSAILGVANASALAAHNAVSRIVAAAEEALVDRINRALSDQFGEGKFKRDVHRTGKSGGQRHFDFALSVPSGEDILINGVLPHPASVSSKYVSFADTEGDPNLKFAVYDRQLDVDDAALLQQVASIVPIKALSINAERVLANAA